MLDGCRFAEKLLKIAFALVAHGNPNDVERLVRILVRQGHFVALHYDRKSPAAAFGRLREAFADCAAVRLAQRVAVHWGEWSVVQGTLNCLDEIRASGWEPDYVYHLSGMDYPIRPSSQLVSFLHRNNGDEFIETVPSDVEQWVKTGPQRERYQYRWYFNWRDQKHRTEFCFNVQRSLGLQRDFVRGLTPCMGSQWWVLTWQTLKKVMSLARARDIRRFFRTTLVPDELFFQTLVRHVAPPDRVVGCPLTLSQFSDYGYPVVYHSDHYDYLLRQNFFMARKVSTHDPRLRDKLDACWSGEVQLAPFPDENVGLLTREYEDWRIAHRDGPPGRPVAGRSQGSWYEDQKRITTPYFAVLGTSTAELRLIHDVLSRQAGLLCHGQVFHPGRIEFGGGADRFAGYAASGLKVRNMSAPGFVTDLIAAEDRRLSGFLLRWGQGWHIPELVVDRPNVRVIMVRGDPLIAFAEDLMGAAPFLSQAFDPDQLRAIPPPVAAQRYRRFLSDYTDHVGWRERHYRKGCDTKPEGWIVRTGPVDESGEWLRAVESCLGLSSRSCGIPDDELDATLRRFALCREIVSGLLMRGGIGNASVELMRAANVDPVKALALA